jgi:hypothetical protein
LVRLSIHHSLEWLFPWGKLLAFCFFFHVRIRGEWLLLFFWPPHPFPPPVLLREEITYQRVPLQKDYACKSSQRPLRIKIFISRVQKEINTGMGDRMGLSPFLGKMLMNECLQPS